VLKKVGLKREYLMGGAERAELIAMLASRLPQGVLQLGKTLDRFEETRDSVISVLTDGDRIESDILVGADGINSRVRELLFGQQNPVFSGHCIWYGVASNVPDEICRQLDGNVYMLFGRGCNMGTYCINRETKKFQFWRTDKSREVTVESWENDVAKEIVRRKMGGKSPIFDALVDHADRLMHFGLYHRETLKKSWHKGRVVLLGDAAHATLPYMSQGANLAIEDAACLAHHLRYPHAEESFQAFHAAREPKTTKLVNEAVMLGKIDLASGVITSTLRNTMYRALNSTGLFTRAAVSMYRQNFSELRGYVD
jgi:salicylate hydroxylase